MRMRKDFMAVLAAWTPDEVITCPYCGNWDMCAWVTSTPMVYHCRVETWRCNLCEQSFDIGMWTGADHNIGPNIERISRHADT